MVGETKFVVVVRSAKIDKKKVYVTLTLLNSVGTASESIERTNVINGPNPVFNTTIEFVLQEGTENFGLLTNVFERRRIFNDKLVGTNILKFNRANLLEDGIVNDWFVIGAKGREINLELKLQVTPNNTPLVINTPPLLPGISLTPTPSTIAITTNENHTNTNNNNNTNNNTDKNTSNNSNTTNNNNNNGDENHTTETTENDEDEDIAITITKDGAHEVKTPAQNGSASKTGGENVAKTENPAKPENGGLKPSEPVTNWADRDGDLLRRSYVVIQEAKQTASDDNSDGEGTDKEGTTAPPVVNVIKLSRGKLKKTYKSEASSSPRDYENDGDDDGDDMNDDDEDNYNYADEGQDWDMSDPDDEPQKPTSLTTSGIFRAREAEISRAKDVLGVPPHIAQALLMHFKWDSEKLFAAFLDDSARVYKSTGVEPPRKDKDKGKGKVPEENGTCSICYTEDVEGTALSCGHWFCNDCWSIKFATDIKEGKSVEIGCMHHKCTELVPEYIVRKIVDPEIFKKYSKFISKAFVESNSSIRWCPRAGCPNAIEVSKCVREGRIMVAKCQCGYKFCIHCCEEAHAPATCDMEKLWKKKCEDDSETFHWIASNTKDCPNKGCGVPIEKNDGCFMMTCRVCKHQFCWLCCESWASHSNHFSCNKYKDEKLDNKPRWLDGRSNQDQRVALDRYLFYYNRYINHQNSLKFEDKTREKAVRTMQLLQENGSSFIDVQFIEQALEKLLDCRRTMKHTYVYAFYCSDPQKKDLFEFSQGDLEGITEKLAQLIETPIEKINTTEIKTITNVASRSLNNLLGDDSL